MTTNTMVAIAPTQTVSGSTTNTINFTGISQSYTDLMLVVNYGVTSSSVNVNFRVGTGTLDTSTSHYSETFLGGNGSSASSGRNTGLGFGRFNIVGGVGDGSTISANIVAHFMNYSNATTYKTILSRAGSAIGTYPATEAEVNLWQQTTAIDTLSIYTSGGYFLAGSTFTLYGIANADIGAYATGGIITQDSTYYYHAFGSSGTFTPSRALTADILVVAGGGGTGGSGAGAGGLFTATAQSLSSGTGYTCTVGSGGATGSAGGNSSFGAISGTIYGGGAGVSVGGGATAGNGGGSGSGGSMGGGSGSGSAAGGSATTAGQGNAGGSSYTFTPSSSSTGGGGGAGGSGGNAATSNSAGAGGIGATSALLNAMALATSTGAFDSGSGNYYYAGGGGGGIYVNGTAGTGAKGGGGNGASNNAAGSNGLAYTGGGAGGAYSPTYGSGYTGGSGIIIVRYAK